MDVSIIVPIYNVENYIKKCVISLLDQTHRNIEFIFVNDATQDNSIAILENIINKYPDRKFHCKIVHHETNKGLGAARKTGLVNATGKYILHIDSDDWCDLNMVKSLFNKAYTENLDVVLSDFYLASKDSLKYIKQHFVKEKILSMIISGEIDNSCCNKLIRRSLYLENGIYPPLHISMAEDRYLIIRLMFFAKKIGYINSAFLYYRQNNTHSLTYCYSSKSLSEFLIFISETKDFLIENSAYTKYKEDFYKMLISHIAFFIRYGEYNFLCDNFPDSLKLRYIWSFKGSSIKRKILKSFLLISPQSFTRILVRIYMDFRR